ncbi:MAG: DNA primase [Bryobacterales bacterium]
MDFAQQVKASVDIVGVVREHVRLKKQGPNRWVGLCPFHGEKTPSFSVHETMQIFKCFGCGKSGDVFSFLMEIQGLTFYESLTTLAQQHGIPIPRRGPGDQDSAETKLRAALYRMHELAQPYFQEELRSPRGAGARSYLEQRGLSQEAIAKFGLGYAPSAGNGLVARFHQEGFSAEHMEGSGLVSARQEGTGFYDRFRDRLMFPIAGDNGNLIAFAGRALQADQQAKYVNSPETLIYKKSSVLYNFHAAKTVMRQSNRVVLVEGYMDVIGVVSAGVDEVVASCGTALTSQQARMIRRQADTIVVNFDADPAGLSATERSIQVLLQEDLKVRVLSLPEGMDPDDFCKRHGAQEYLRLLDKAPDYFIWLADRARSRFDMNTGEGRLDAFKFLVPAIHWLPDKIHRASLADELASYLRLEDRSLALEQIRRAAVERRQTPGRQPAPHPYSQAEKLLIRLLLESPEARQEMLAGVYKIAMEQQLPSAPIFEALHAVESAGGPFAFSAVEGRLEENHRQAQSQILFERDQPPCTLEEGRQAYAALERKALEKNLIDVRRAMAEADKNGDRQECVRLLQVQSELKRRLTLGEGGRAAGA